MMTHTYSIPEGKATYLTWPLPNDHALSTSLPFFPEKWDAVEITHNDVTQTLYVFDESVRDNGSKRYYLSPVLP